MVQRHPSQRCSSSSFARPRRTKCHNQLREHLLGKTLQDLRSFQAIPLLKKPTVRMRTMYLKHRGLASNLPAHFHLAQQLLLHHLVHTKLEFDVPTTTDERYTSHACCRPIQNNVAQVLLVQFLLHHFELHQLMLLQGAQLLQTTALKVEALPLFHNVNNVQLREYTDASQIQRGPSL